MLSPSAFQSQHAEILTSFKPPLPWRGVEIIQASCSGACWVGVCLVPGRWAVVKNGKLEAHRPHAAPDTDVAELQFPPTP